RRPANARSASAASSFCSSTAASSTCSKPARKPAGTNKRKGPDEAEPYSSFKLKTNSRSVEAVGELVMAPAAALHPQRNEDVLHGNELFAQFHAVRCKHRRLFADNGRCSRFVHHDPLVAAVGIVPQRVQARRVAPLCKVGREIAV